MTSEDSNEASESAGISFKRVSRRPARKRRASSGSSSGEEAGGAGLRALQEARELQALRRRPNGVSVGGEQAAGKAQAGGKPAPQEGGMLNMAALKSGKLKPKDDAYDTGIGTQFSAETNKRDEDEEMMKYIEERLSRGRSEAAEAEAAGRYLSPEEAALQALPEHLRTTAPARSEEMLSNQMLSGIPEVDLGIDAKIKNIEATEEAKLRLVWQQRHKPQAPSAFVPANMAVNYVQHNRFSVDSGRARQPRAGNPSSAPAALQPAVPGNTTTGSTNSKGERATDDYHYEKFKKQFRRY